MAQHRGEPSHLLGCDIDVAVSIDEKQIDLLHLVLESGRAWNEVPVDVRVPGLASERQHVQPFAFDDLLHGFADPMHDALECHVLLLAKVCYHPFAVLARGDENVSVDGWIFVQERDGLWHVEDHVVLEARFLGHERADEAAHPARFKVSLQVERDTPVHPLQPHGLDSDRWGSTALADVLHTRSGATVSLPAGTDIRGIRYSHLYSQMSRSS